MFDSEENFLNEFLRIAFFVSEQDEYKDYDEFKDAARLYESLIRDEDLYFSYYNSMSFSRDLVISFMDNKKHKKDVTLFIDKWNQELLVKNEKGFKIVFNIEEKINYLLSLNNHKLKMYYLYDFNDGEIKAKVRGEVHDWFKSLELSEKLLNKLSTFFDVESHLFVLVYQILFQKVNEELTKSCLIPVFKKYKKRYRKATLIKHRKDEFITFVSNNYETYYLDTDSITLMLSDFIDYEVDKHNNLPKNQKYKQQALIDFTPQQTLSIETTSATEEVGKKDEIIIKDEVNGKPCDEFDKLFGADIARKNEVWKYMKLLGMIDNEGKCLHPEKTATIRAFVVVMRKNFKLPFAKSPDELVKIFGSKLSISDTVRVRSATEIELKEQEIIKLLNAFETKTLPFT